MSDTIGRVSKQRLFILDLLLYDHSYISGDIALRIQHDVGRCHTKTSKPGHLPWRFLTCGIISFSLGYNSPDNKVKTPLCNQQINNSNTLPYENMTMSPEVVKTLSPIETYIK